MKNDLGLAPYTMPIPPLTLDADKIPGFVYPLMTTKDPKDSYYKTGCNLKLLSDGLAAGFIRWNDGEIDPVVYYDVNTWGDIADKLAPRTDDLDTSQPSGGIGGFTHSRLNTDDYLKGYPKLGRFWSISRLDPYKLAEGLLSAKI